MELFQWGKKSQKSQKSTYNIQSLGILCNCHKRSFYDFQQLKNIFIKEL